MQEYRERAWMSYQDFQQLFDYTDSNQQRLTGTKGAETWLGRKMLISAEDAHKTNQTGEGIWEAFSCRTRMMKGLFAYESAFRNYTRELILHLVKDNIQYAEIRSNFMKSNSLKTDDGEESLGNEKILEIIKEVSQSTIDELRKKKKYFGGMKVIYCIPRSFRKNDVEEALVECISLKEKYGSLLCGFDLVGPEEKGHSLKHFAAELRHIQQECRESNIDIPFLFHCGETLQVGGVVDGNLIDAIILNAKQIGHGYALAAHPTLLSIYKEKGIAVESCPISNEILGLTPNIAGHNLPILLANGVPCTINSDNATFFGSSLSHDFYQVMVGSKAMNLFGWKQLAKWSIEHSCMSLDEKKKPQRCGRKDGRLSVIGLSTNMVNRTQPHDGQEVQWMKYGYECIAI